MRAVPDPRFARRAARALGVAGLLALAAAAPAAAADVDSAVVAPDRFDFAVPDAPAFKLLGGKSRSILRPGTRREIGVVVENASLDDFGVEFAPFLLARDGAISRADYLKRRQLYNLRLSLGTRTPDGGPTTAAVGLRLGLLDGSDPYADPELVAAAVEAAEDIQAVRERARDEIRDSLGTAEAFAALPAATRESLIEARTARARLAAERRFEAARRKLKSEWNRDVLELGLAVAGSRPDTGAVRADAYAGWLTGGLRLGTRGQVLLGGNGRVLRGESGGALDRGEGSAALRFYYGGNAAKASASFDAAWLEGARAAYSGNLGAEFRLIPSLWVNVGVGLADDGDAPARISTEFDLRYAIAGAIPSPELLRGP